METKRKAMSDVQLIDDVSHVEQLPPGKDFMECNGTLWMGTAQGYDLCLVVINWHVGGGPKGKWMVDKANIGHTTFQMIPHDERYQMHDNDYIGNRQDAREWEGEKIQITPMSDRVIWKHANREFINRPPYWEVKGEHMGVECDLVAGAMGNCTRVYGPLSDLKKTLWAGYEQRCWGEGTITVGGKKYTFEKAYACHDVMTLGETYDHMKNMREPYYYIWAIDDTIQTYIWRQRGSGVEYSRVYVDGEETPFGGSEISIDELEWWLDPKTGMSIPIRWHVNLNSARGVVDMNMVAGGRGSFSVMTRNGSTMRHGFLVRANGNAFFPDGRKIPIKDMMTYLEWGRSAMPLESGAP